MDLFGDAPADEIEDFDAEDAPYTPHEPDEEFGHPRTREGAAGFEGIESHLLKLFKNGRMPHGLVFAGPKGIGKATFAFALARFMFKYGGVDPNEIDMFGEAPVIPDNLDVPKDDRIFSLVASGGHPDLLTIERAYDEGKNKTAASVAVADIRRVNPFLRKTASEAGWRVVIIDDADTMNRSAQNALLKILEEPPKNTLLILIAHRPGALIPTIKSRTQTLNFTAPPQEIFAKLLSGNVPSAEIDTLYAITRGSVGRALEMAEQGGLDTVRDLQDVLAQRPHWDWADIHKLGDTLGKNGKDEAYRNFTFLLVWMIGQVARAKARGAEIEPASLRFAALQSLKDQSSLEELLEICDKMDKHFLQVDRANLDKKQAVLRAFSMLAA